MGLTVANEKHLLLTATGGWVASDLANEVWQVGLRLVLNFGGTDPIDTLPNNWDLVQSSISRTETDWNIDGNWSVDGPSLSTFQPDDYLNDQAAPAFTEWMDTAGRSTGCRLDFLKIYPIGTNGKAIPAPPYAAGSPVTLTWTDDNPLGPTAGNLMPINNAVVTSHRTGQVGRPGRGRMFVPGLAAGAQGADGLLEPTVQDLLMDGQVALLEALSIVNSDPADPDVYPIITGGDFTRYAVITQVRVGNVFDTQNRRRRQLTETYLSSSVTY